MLGFRTLSRGFVLALGLLALACGGAADPGTGSSGADGSASIDELVARHVEARGGADRLAALETVRMSGRVKTGPGQEAIVSREVRPPGRIRTEFTHQGVTSVYACDGEVCWYVDPMQGVFDAEVLSGEEAALAVQEADVLAALDWREKGHQVELVGPETIDGRETLRFDIVLSSGPTRTVYVDAETALVVRREMLQQRGGQSIEVRTDYGDFREVDGLVFPHSIRTGAVGSDDILEVTVERIEVNGPLDDARFVMPQP